MKISVCLSTRRYGGLLKQIEFFKYQTFPKDDFELVIIDGLYWQREKDVIKMAKDCGLNLIYKAPRRLTRKVSIDHPSMRNDALTYANGELIVFFDDYQIPDEHLLTEHWRIHKEGYCCQGRQLYFEVTDFDDIKEMKLKSSGNTNLGMRERVVTPTTFYTHNCSAPLAELIKINGFDERFNSGTGGEDYNCGFRLGLMGNRFKYNPEALCYHMEHHSVPIYVACPDICPYIGAAGNKEKFLEMYPTMREENISWIDWDNVDKYRQSEIDGEIYYNHDRKLIYAHPNFTGKKETPLLEIYLDEDGVVFCKCKICGWDAVIDSVPLHQNIMQNKRAIAPIKYFDLAKTRREKQNDIG